MSNQLQQNNNDLQKRDLAFYATLYRKRKTKIETLSAEEEVILRRIDNIVLKSFNTYQANIHTNLTVLRDATSTQYDVEKLSSTSGDNETFEELVSVANDEERTNDLNSDKEQQLERDEISEQVTEKQTPIQAVDDYAEEFDEVEFLTMIDQFSSRELADKYGTSKFITKIRQSAQIYDWELDTFANSNSSKEFYNMDQKLQTLMRKIDDLCGNSRSIEKRQERIELLRYVMSLQDKLDKRALRTEED